MWWIESNRFSPLTRQPLSNKPMLCCECALASSGKKAPPLAKVLVTTRHLSNTSERDNIILKIEKPPGRNRKGSSSTGMFEVFIGTTRYNKEKRLQIGLWFASKALCTNYTRTCRHAGKKANQTRNDQAAGSYRCKGLFVKKITHKKQINCIVQLLDQAAAQQRQRKQQQLFPDGALCQVTCALCNLFQISHSPCCLVRERAVCY